MSSDHRDSPLAECASEAGGLFPGAWSTIAISLVFLIPCFWQERIQAGDLGSHIYNTWLAQLIHQGTAPGLWIAPLTNNVLFDILLEVLSRLVGFGPAQRIAVGFMTLLFAGGAYFFIGRVSASRALHCLPFIWILAYGVLFHAGFFNFYLSLGFCLWYLGAIWGQGWRRALLFAPLLVPAWLAHPFPVLWALGVALYAGIAFVLPPQSRAWLLLGAVVTLVASSALINHRYPHQLSPKQVFLITGANMAVVYGTQYKWIMAGLLVVWFSWLLRLRHAVGLKSLVRSVSVQAWLLTAAAVVLISDVVVFPQYAIPFSFVTARLSLFAAILFCAVVAPARVKTPERLFIILLAMVFSVMLYMDERTLNHREDLVTAALEQIPAGQRVVSSLPAPFSFIDHILDRACIGHCLSYANYEPASRQFRVRAQPGNSIVMANYADVQAVEIGHYTVRDRDLPLYTLEFCDPAHRQICARATWAGEVVGMARH